jgi:hypothetical protein
MKITYEPGDYVQVEDNMEAGKSAACEVQLLHKNLDGSWAVRIEYSDKLTDVHEQFLRP